MMSLITLLILISKFCVNSNNSLAQRQRRLLATKIECSAIKTGGEWSYGALEDFLTCYDANPDAAKFPNSIQIQLSQSQSIILVSATKLTECDISCKGCFGPKLTDCIQCSSDTRGNNVYITVDKINVKSGINCPCSSNYNDTGRADCTCLDPNYLKSIDGINFCIKCPLNFLSCQYTQMSGTLSPLTCKTGIGRNSSVSSNCSCLVDYEEFTPVAADCKLKCQKPCGKCIIGSDTKCSQCYHNIMLYNSTDFTCKCPTQYYYSSVDALCHACYYTCQTCNEASSMNCLSCIQESQRKLTSGQCICPEHYVISSNLQCVQCDWSCDTCRSKDSCYTCMTGDNRQVGPSGFCECIPGFAEDLSSSTCVKCSQLCLTCQYQYDTCTSCPQNSFRSLINSQCQCQNYYYTTGDIVCQQCHFTCLQCNGPQDYNCINCDNQLHRVLNDKSECACQQGYGYLDDFTLECQLCNQYCLTCSQINNCLTCPQNTYRLLNEINQCVCNDGFYEQSNQLLCKKCHFTCQTCNDFGPDKCLSCNYDDGRELKNTQCGCLSGYYEFFKICTPCYYTCLSCINQFQDGCTSCPSSRQLLNNLNPSQCICKSVAQIDDGQSLECSYCHYTCQTCYGVESNNCLTCYDNSNDQNKISRFIKYGICSCPQYWFDDGQSEVCQKCHPSCLSCFNTFDQGCITCSDIDFRKQTSNSCTCIDGYFEEIRFSQKSCNQCDYRCATCIKDQTNCLTCPYGSLRTLTLQKNSSGFYTCSCPNTQPNDSQGNPICQACHFSCSNCSGPDNNLCTECADQNNRLLSTDINGQFCQCKQSYYDIGYSECASCTALCQNCKATASNCTSCDPALFRMLSGNTCICGTRFGTKYLSYYDNNLDPECVACHYSCYTCNGPEYNQCLTCSDLDFRVQSGHECQCRPKYIDNGEGQCMTCDYTCETCFGHKQNCLSCPAGSLRSLNVQSQSCECPLSYYDAGIQLCQQCDKNCYSCTNQSTTCLSCVFGSNRIYNQFNYSCDCLYGYYDVGDGTCSICHFSCLQCKGPLKSDCTLCPNFQTSLRILNNNYCTCADKYYDDQINQICQVCSSTCFTCENNRNECTQCLLSQNRTLNGKSCSCNQSYYESGSDVCQKCSDYCLKCQNTSTQCTECDLGLNRYLNQQKCDCLDGFYDDNQLQCTPCHYSCQKCSNTTTCTACDQNNLRELINGQCVCMSQTLEQGVSKCGICDFRCQTCSSQLNHCTTCDETQNRDLNGSQCNCKSGYFENDIYQCQQCNQQCQTCQYNDSYCISCQSNSNKVVNSQNTCVCDNGYYTDSNDNCQICSNECLLCYYTASHCLTCKMNRILVNNVCQCLDGSYNTGQSECQLCSITCQTCSGQPDNCLTCSLTSNRRLQGSQCLCKSGFYDIGSSICQACDNQCNTCVSSSTNCQTCDSTQFREQIGNECQCKPEYFDNGSALCQVCDLQCETCTQSSNKCTSCDISTTFRMDQSQNFFSCPCNKGFYDDSTKICKKCSYQCLNCVDSSTNCTSCNNNPGYYRLNLLPTCDCYDGYYDDGIQVICQKCDFKCQTCKQDPSNCLTCESPSTRNTSPLCDCSQGYYLDSLSQKCNQCSIQCQTCSNKADNCNSCQPDRFTKQCLCQDGFYESNQLQCQQCSYKCSTCQNHQLNCITCAQDRINPPNCTCKEHYYDDYINDQCQLCNQYCGKCDFNGCIDCAANRIKSGHTCVCPTDSISYLDISWCSNCDVAVINGRFSDDLEFINFTFEYPLKFNFPNLIDIQAHCEKIVLPESLNLLGQSPQCSIQNDTLLIQLGDGATVIVGDIINFNSSFLKHTQCDNSLSNIQRTIVNQPNYLLKPSIKLDFPTLPISPCQQIQININKQLITGERNLIMFWKSSIPLSEVEQANQFQFQTLTIEEGSLPQNSQINISLQFTNFLNQSDQQTITITTLTSNTPQFLFYTTKKSFTSWSPIKLNVFYSNKGCSNSQQQNVKQDISIQFEEIASLKNPISSKSIAFTQNLFNLQDSENLVSTIIPARTLSIDTNYSILATYKDLSSQMNLTTQLDIQIIRSPLLVQIVGGTRVQNYLKSFTVEIQTKDPDLQTEWNTDPNIQLEVSCLDVQHNNQPCQDLNGKTIRLNKTLNIQYIGQRLFHQFQVVIFKVTCKKQMLIGSDQAAIIFLDTDLPTVDVSYPIGYNIRDVNINEELQFEIQINKNQLIKNIQFSYALIYNYELVYMKFIPNQKLKFAIWDDFINFSFINKISIRIQAHDINYLMPSVSSTLLSVNMPPVMFTISIQPQFGNAYFTKFQFRVQNAKDTDTPIQYRFAYYQSQKLQDTDIKKGQNDHLFILQDYSTQQKFIGLLESGNLTIIISVSDSQGSTVNYTQQVQVQSFYEQMQSSNQTCDSFIQEFFEQTHDYKQLITISRELIKLLNQNISVSCSKQIYILLSKFKDVLFVELASQTNLNTQTIISNLLGQLFNIEQINTRRLIQDSSQSICYDSSKGLLQINNYGINNQSEQSSLLQQLNSLKAQIDRSIEQNINLISDYQQSVDIGDQFTFRRLQQVTLLRKSYINALGGLYQYAYESRATIRDLINQLSDSFQKNIETDQGGIILRTPSIGVQISKMGQINFQKFITLQKQDDDYNELSNFQINRFIQISKYSTNIFRYNQNFTNQFQNGTYKIKEIDTNISYYLKSIIPIDQQSMYDPFIYVDINNQLIQVQQIHQGYLAYNMGQYDECTNHQPDSIHEYSLVCSNYYNNNWEFDQCQLDQQTNSQGKLIFICYCSKVNPITLMIQNITHFNKIQLGRQSIFANIYELIHVGISYNMFNISIITLYVLLLIIIVGFKCKKHIVQVNDIMFEMETIHSEFPPKLTELPQMSTKLFKQNLIFLHEITRIITTRLCHLDELARSLLLMFNISVSITILHIFVALLGRYSIALCIALVGSLILQILTKIFEGFFTGPKPLLCLGYGLLVSLNIGLIIINTILKSLEFDTIKESCIIIYDSISVLTLLILLYGPIEIALQYVKLKIGFQVYRELKSDNMNPTLNFIYYFLQDEILICIVKGAIID